MDGGLLLPKSPRVSRHGDGHSPQLIVFRPLAVCPKPTDRANVATPNVRGMRRMVSNRNQGAGRLKVLRIGITWLACGATLRVLLTQGPRSSASACARGTGFVQAQSAKYAEYLKATQAAIVLPAVGMMTVPSCQRCG